MESASWSTKAVAHVDPCTWNVIPHWLIPSRPLKPSLDIQVSFPIPSTLFLIFILMISSVWNFLFCAFVHRLQEPQNHKMGLIFLFVPSVASTVFDIWLRYHNSLLIYRWGKVVRGAMMWFSQSCLLDERIGIRTQVSLLKGKLISQYLPLHSQPVAATRMLVKGWNHCFWLLLGLLVSQRCKE